MAEISALTHSPQGLGDPRNTPAQTPPDPQHRPGVPNDASKSPVPKSALYTDPAVMGPGSRPGGLVRVVSPARAKPAVPLPPAKPGAGSPTGHGLRDQVGYADGSSGPDRGAANLGSRPADPPVSPSPHGVGAEPRPHGGRDEGADRSRLHAPGVDPQTPVEPHTSPSPQPWQNSDGGTGAPPPPGQGQTDLEKSAQTPQQEGAEPPPGPQSPAIPLVQEPPQLSGSVSLLPGVRRGPPAPDTLSYLESASLMSGTLESLAGLGDDASSLGSDSEINGMTFRRTDKYGFLGGSQYSENSEREMRVEVARQREMKWLDMFNNWDKWVSRRFQKVKLRCRKGIPSSLRAKAWQFLSNSKEVMDQNPGKFEALEREPGDPKWLDIIEKDLHRQFPFHEMFAARGGHGQQDLYRILKAYTVYRPEEGYCQAQAPVAAVLLMHMPAEQAFWCLVQICEKYLPGYYSAGLEAIQLDGEIFFSLLRRVCPMAYRHLKKFKIDPILYMTEWFMCVYSRTLPWACVLRVWDMFFCEGVKIIFRVGLVLLRQMLGSVQQLRECQGMYETMERLRNIPPDNVKEEALVHEVISLPVTEALIERESKVQVKRWRETRGELQHQPCRRLHGTRAIQEQRLRSSHASLPPPAGPLRSSASLLSLPTFRRTRGDASSLSQLPPAALRLAHNPPPSPKVVSEAVVPTLPSPTANNTPLPVTGALGEAPGGGGGAEEGKKKKKSREDKKREKEEEKQRAKERKEREKVEKAERERQKKEKEKAEKERKKSGGGKKKENGGAAAATAGETGADGQAEENGAAEPKDTYF
ncbi:TBC1 domain family member 10B [Lepisosteus oculatus]|uniref:TBC1 domain family member 10B n=1 Tax=Lepisosteus oculatus TaxID=7918 RepID=UPI00371681BF